MDRKKLRFATLLTLFRLPFIFSFRLFGQVGFGKGRAKLFFNLWFRLRIYLYFSSRLLKGLFRPCFTMPLDSAFVTVFLLLLHFIFSWTGLRPRFGSILLAVM
jgi:hypothetical protein